MAVATEDPPPHHPVTVPVYEPAQHRKLHPISMRCIRFLLLLLLLLLLFIYRFNFMLFFSFSLLRVLPFSLIHKLIH